MFKPKKRGSRHNVAFRHIFVIAMVLFIIFTMWGLWIINRGIKPALMTIAKNQAQQISQYAISQAIDKDGKSNTIDPVLKGTEDIINITYNNNGDPIVDFKAAEANSIRVQVQNRIQSFLRSVENGERSIDNGQISAKVEGSKSKGVVARVPLGQATGNALLTNLGPSVPVRLEVIGNVNADLVPQTKLVGIDNTMIQIYIVVKVDVNVVIPFAASSEPVSTKILLDYGYVKGQVPNFYGGGNGGLSPSIQIPGFDEKTKKK